MENHQNFQVTRCTEDVITFRSRITMRRREPYTRVLFLDESGVRTDQTFSQMIDFGKPGMQLNLQQKGAMTSLPALVLKKENFKTKLSAMKIQNKLAQR